MSCSGRTAPAKSTEKPLNVMMTDKGLKLRTLLSTLNLSYPYHISTECTCQGDRDRVQADEGHGKGYPTGWHRPPQDEHRTQKSPCMTLHTGA